MKNKFLFLVLTLFLTATVFAAFGNPSSSGFFGGSTSSWQSTQPSFNRLYSGDIGNYWPILSNMENDQCEATSDFVIAIPPLGCTPTVVRSDLLEEQNVPVFCQLYAVKINPLISVASIKSISFKGAPPEGVAGISFHPARAAVRSYNTLLGDPLINNIGYVVIILKKERVEKNMEEWIAGNLTATIHYDAVKAYGTGRAEYYLPATSDEVWEDTAEQSSFWGGKGYVRVTDIERDYARIDIMTSKDNVLQSFSLKEGETSPLVYMPGYYCKAGLKVQLNRLETPEDSALLNIDGSETWVRRGSKVLDNACTVSQITLDTKKTETTTSKTTTTATSSTTTKEVWPQELLSVTYKGDSNSISLGKEGVADIPLVGKDSVTFETLDPSGNKVSRTGLKIEFNYNGNKYIYYVDSNNLATGKPNIIWKDTYIEKIKSGVISSGVYSSGEKLRTGSIRISCPGKTLTLYLKSREDGTVVGDISKKEIDEYFNEGLRTVEDLVDKYPFEDKGGKLGYHAEDALYAQILLAERAGKHLSASKLIDLYLETYPESTRAYELSSKKSRLAEFNYEGAIGGAFVNGDFHTFGLYELNSSNQTNKTVKLGVRGIGIIEKKEGEKIYLASGNQEYIEVSKIYPSRVTLAYRNNRNGAEIKSDSKTIYEGERDILGLNTDVSVENIEAGAEAHVLLIPQVKNTQTEANFSFKIGIEKRAIQLSPEKTKEMLANVNKTIERLEDINEKLGNLITGWKGACFATSAVLTIKNMISGFDGTTLARQKVMERFRAICDEEYGDSKYRDQCYSEKADEIEANVTLMKNGLNKVNEIMEKYQDQNVVTGGLFGDDRIENDTKYKEDLRNELGSWSMEVNGEKLTARDLQTTEQLRAALLQRELSSSGGISAEIANAEANATLRNLATINLNKRLAEEASVALKGSPGIGQKDPKVIAYQSVGAETFTWTGEKYSDYTDIVSVKDKEGKRVDLSKRNIQFFEYDGRKHLFILSDGSTNMGVENAFVLENNQWTEVSRDRFSKLVFSRASYGLNGKGCDNPWPKGTMKVSFYESGNNQKLPAIVPFDSTKGLYAMVPNSGGTFIEDVPKGYTASGDVTYFKICSIGINKLMESGKGDDICQTFSVNSAGSIQDFAPCPELSGKTAEVQRIYNSAREAIRQASAQYGQKTISIFNQLMSVDRPFSEVGGFECQDFMSPEDCKLMFNVCDPVICPPSRCDLGGRFPVTDVIQTGIIGSIALCLPNFQEGIYVPICITGIHAGLEAYTSILKSERECLTRSLENGEHVGICDEVTSIYKCEFFWNQLSPVMDMLLPKLVTGISGTGQGTRGGGEYMLIDHAWKTMEKSVSYFKDIYAQNSFRAFQARSTQEVGSTFCKAFLGTSVPSSADALESLLKPDSPVQFYAYFSENVFTEATVPATSHYKVYYHIFAGNDQGSYYQVYLKNPPASSYYRETDRIPVDSGFIARGAEVDQAKDFTAPAGYKELCVVINAQEYCDFKQVTTDFGLNFLKKEYTDEQAKTTDITTEKECISGTPSALPLAAPNLQAGLQESIDPEISLRGIVRVCASNNPDGSTANSVRWKEVGYCGDPTLKCWLNEESVEEDLKMIQALEGDLNGDLVEAFGIFSGETDCSKVQTKLKQMNTNGRATYKEVRDYTKVYGDGLLNCQEINTAIDFLKKEAGTLGQAENRLGLIGSTRLTYEQAEEILSKAREDRDKLGKGSTFDQAKEIISELDKISGYAGDNVGSGTNAQKAESLALRASIYGFFVSRGLESSLPAQPKAGREEGVGIGATKETQTASKQTEDEWYIEDPVPLQKVEVLEDLEVGDVLEFNGDLWVVKNLDYQEDVLLEVTLEEHFTGILDFIEPQNYYETLQSHRYYYVGYVSEGKEEEIEADLWEDEIIGAYSKGTNEIILSNSYKAKIDGNQKIVLVMLVYYILEFKRDGAKEGYKYLLPVIGFDGVDDKEYKLLKYSSKLSNQAEKSSSAQTRVPSTPATGPVSVGKVTLEESNVWSLKYVEESGASVLLWGDKEWFIYHNLPPDKGGVGITDLYIKDSKIYLSKIGPDPKLGSIDGEGDYSTIKINFGDISTENYNRHRIPKPEYLTYLDGLIYDSNQHKLYKLPGKADGPTQE